MGLCESGDCPEIDYTSDLTFDGSFANITVPSGSDLNDVLLLMETYFNNTLLALADVTYTITEPNCLGLSAGEYSHNQVFAAVIETLCELVNSTPELLAHGLYMRIFLYHLAF